MSPGSLGCHGPRLGDGPAKARQLPGHGHDHWGGRLPPCHESARALAPSHVGLPAQVRDDLGWLCASSLEVATHWGRSARRPGAFNERSTGMRLARVGEGTLPAALTPGRLRGEQPQECHQGSGGIDACQVAQCRHRGDRHDDLDAAQGLEGCDAGRSTPGGALRGACVCATLEAFRVCMDRPALRLEDHVRGRRGTDDRTAPPEGGWTPGGPAGRAAILAQAKRFAPACGGLELTAGALPRPCQVAHGVIGHGGDRPRRESPRAQQAGPWHGVPTVGLHPVARRFGTQRGGHHRAGLALFREIARAPVATRSCVRDNDPGVGLGWPCADAVREVTVSGADAAQVEDLSVRIVRDLSHRDGLLRDIHPDVKRARLLPG
jgi:hypothetical protein